VKKKENSRTKAQTKKNTISDKMIEQTVKDFVDASEGDEPLAGWFPQRYFQGLFTVIQDRYQKFVTLLDVFREKKRRRLLEWATLYMKDPPTVLDTSNAIEHVVEKFKARVVADLSSDEATQKRDIERIFSTEFKIQEIINDIGDLANNGIRLNDMFDHTNGVFMNFEEERAAYQATLTEDFQKASKDLSKGKEEEAQGSGDDETDEPTSPVRKPKKSEPPTTPQKNRAALLQAGSDVNTAVDNALKDKDNARREWMEKVADSLKPIQRFIALSDVKRDIAQLIITFMADPLEFSDRHNNIAFFGEPGTGKTEIGTRLGSLFYALGFITRDPGGRFSALSRADFVSGIVGQTVGKVQDMFLDNLGSMMFIDEAYGLHTDNEDTFGSEAVHEITNELQVYKGLITVVIAGYRDKIVENLFKENPGLPSRFPEQWTFRPYSSPELYHIFSFLAKKRNVSLDKNDVRQTLYNIVSVMNQDAFRMFRDANGRAMGTILSWIIRSASQRKLKKERDEGGTTPRRALKGSKQEFEKNVITSSTTPIVSDLIAAFNRWAEIPHEDGKGPWSIKKDEVNGQEFAPVPKDPSFMSDVKGRRIVVRRIPKRKQIRKPKPKRVRPDQITEPDTSIVGDNKEFERIVGKSKSPREGVRDYFNQNWLDEDFDAKLESDATNGYSLDDMTEMLKTITQDTIPAADEIMEGLLMLKKNYELAVWKDETRVADAEEDVKPNPLFKTWIRNMGDLYGMRTGEGSKGKTSRTWKKDPDKGSYIDRQEIWIGGLKTARNQLVIEITNRAVNLSQLPTIEYIQNVESTTILGDLIEKALDFTKGKKRRIPRGDPSKLREIYATLRKSTDVQSRIDNELFYFY
jgi:stage V sporulation protein K